MCSRRGYKGAVRTDPSPSGGHRPRRVPWPYLLVAAAVLVVAVLMFGFGGGVTTSETAPAAVSAEPAAAPSDCEGNEPVSEFAIADCDSGTEAAGAEPVPAAPREAR
jgi:hypothetical protein